MQLEVVIPLVTSALAAVVAGARWVGGLIQQNRLDRIEEHARLVVELTEVRAELKTERQEHLKTLKAWQSWRLKYGPTLESDSSPPPSS